MEDYGDVFELVFEVDGKVVDRKVEYCVEDCLIDSSTFFSDNCEKNLFDSRFDRIEVELKFIMGM
jgi:hypothetical protein